MPYVELRLKIAGAILLAICAVMFYRTLHPSTTFAADGIDRDWDRAARHSQEAGQPTVVLFTADWCPACRMLHHNVLSRNDVQNELQSHYCFYTVDLTHPSPQVQAHAQKFSVEYIPLLIRYDASGNETARTNNLGPQEMISWLKAGE